MLYLHKIQNQQGGWNWQLGQLTLAHSYVTSTTEDGLFLFSIKGVHRQKAELFSSHKRAEALLAKHLGAPITVDAYASGQFVQVAREDRWVKRKRDDPAEQEEDTYTYYIGNVLLGELANYKSIKRDGYSLHLSSSPARPPIRNILSITTGEQLLKDALQCAASIVVRGVTYGLGPNYSPCDGAGFACRPTLYSGGEAW
jgi:hypothetical protein